MKKGIIKVLAFLFPLMLAVGVAYFLPNELNVKRHALAAQFATTPQEEKKEYEQMKTVFPKWGIISENNALGILYAEKKYEEVEKKISNILNKKCNLARDRISEFCANIFYLEGLTQYQLGKNLESKKQKPFFEKAIFSFAKVMAMTPKNSREYVWSKENIEFLQNKFRETQRKEKEQKGAKNQEKKNGGKQGEEKNKEKSAKEKSGGNNEKNGEQNNKGNEKSRKGEKEKQGDGASRENNASENKRGGNENNHNMQKAGDNKNQKGEASKKSSDDKQGGGGKNEDKTKNNTSSSRLPQEMQRALEQAQQQLEEAQKSQKGFYRSQSAAQREKQDMSDPFGIFQNDPFFQEFFGNDPFFQNQFGKKRFTRQLRNANEKDW